MQQYGGKSTEKQLDTTLIDFHLSHSFDADTVVLYEFSVRFANSRIITSHSNQTLHLFRIFYSKQRLF